MAKTIGIATLSLADLFGQMRPDLLLLIADRYEMLAPASVALALRIPIAHIEGGEISEGAIDDAVRNALTKMSHIHFTSTYAARQRVIHGRQELAQRYRLSREKTRRPVFSEEHYPK
jgi:UDP-N-acetylglucosamine 2-epimerase